MLKSLSPPQGWRVGARRFAPCLISHIGDFKEPGRKPASATARPSLCEAHAEAFTRSGNCREHAKLEDGRSGIALSNLYVRSFDRPPAASGAGRSTPGIRKTPTGRLMAFVSPLAEGPLGGAVSKRVSGKPPDSLTSRTVSGLPPGLIPDAETSFRTAGADPSPVRRCAPGLPMKGLGQGKGRWRAVDKISGNCWDSGDLPRSISHQPFASWLTWKEVDQFF